jgi:hypothetical protein
MPPADADLRAVAAAWLAKARGDELPAKLRHSARAAVEQLTTALGEPG